MFILDVFEVAMAVLFAGAVISVWLVVQRRGDWMVFAHRVSRFVIALSVLAVLVRCLDAAVGGDTRIGSPSIGVRAAAPAIAVHVETKPIDPDRIPSARLLNAQGFTAVEARDDGTFRWASLTQASFEIEIPDPPDGGRLAVVFSGAVSLIPWFVGLLAIERILRRARRGEPFSRGNVRDLRWLAFAVSGGVYLAFAVDFFVTRWVSDDASTNLNLGNYSAQAATWFDIPLIPLVAGALVLALAEVWRQAIVLHEEAQATV